MDAQQLKHLLCSAHESLKYTYSPYSEYPVGAAVLTEDGRTFTGTNIENSSYSLTICAERVAIFKAVSEGAKRIVAVAVVCAKGHECMPCGACRQVISEFSADAQIVVEDSNGAPRVVPLTDLLPQAFSAKDLQKTV
jgi:cytidine deaminase